MQLRAGLVKIVIGVSMLAGLCLPAQAAPKAQNNLMCAAYMDIMLKDIVPLGIIPNREIKTLWVNSIASISAYGAANNKSGVEAVNIFIDTRDNLRRLKYAQVGITGSLSLTGAKVEAYSINLANEATPYCVAANTEISNIFKGRDMAEFKPYSDSVIAEMQRIGER